jgi:hypothetical protein
MIDLSRKSHIPIAARARSSQRFPPQLSSERDASEDNQALETARGWIRTYPGAALLVGLVTGGVIGWLTSKLK